MMTLSSLACAASLVVATVVVVVAVVVESPMAGIPTWRGNAGVLPYNIPWRTLLSYDKRLVAQSQEGTKLEQHATVCAYCVCMGEQWQLEDQTLFQ